MTLMTEATFPDSRECDIVMDERANMPFRTTQPRTLQTYLFAALTCPGPERERSDAQLPLAITAPVAAVSLGLRPSSTCRFVTVLIPRRRIA